MQFQNSFEVDAPIEQVWETVLDVERVTPNVPGARVLERTGDNAYKVAIKVKVGPMSMTYNGEVEITERDDAAHRAVMKARAKESRGQGTADADVTMELSSRDGGTAATVSTDVKLTGKVATMGQGVMKDVSGRLISTFADNLAAMLSGEQQPAAADATTTAAAEPVAPAASEPAAAPAAGSTAQASPPPEEADALDLGSLGGAMVADRMRDPKALGGVLAAVALIFFVLGRRSRG
jgi:carbon monoxide dehydrogenase subunit G